MSKTNPNILLLFSDEHNHRFFGHKSSEVGEPVNTPGFTELANSSTVMDNTYCSVPLCTPSRISLLTGKEARNSGAWVNKSVLKPGLPTLPETLGEAGYETCLVGKMHFGGSRQFGGFNHRPYGDLTGQHGHQPDPLSPSRRNIEPLWVGMETKSRIVDAGITEIPESLHQEQVVVRETLTFLREHTDSHPEQPWFLCASFSRPHFPLTAPRRFFEHYWPDNVTSPKVGREGDTSDHLMSIAKCERQGPANVTEEQLLKARAAYFASVEYLDEIISDLLGGMDRTGLLDDTVVVYLSDHGEMAGEHGMWWKRTFHESSTRVPWMVQLPGHRTGDIDASEISTPTSLLDVFPTLCGLAGVEPPDGLDGVDLSESVTTGKEPDRGPVFTDLLSSPPQHHWILEDEWPEGLRYRMVRDGPYKYVHFEGASDVLIHLERDPMELENLAPDATDEDAAALSRLRKIASSTMDFDAAEAERQQDAAKKAGEYALLSPKGTGNAYHLPDGRVVDAGSPIYSPNVLIEDPKAVYDDWPSNESGRSDNAG